ncbi:MAG: carboxypeptidase-like regulatory domain-containing protein, partial [Flavisolibacter sp.]|nr:carboxypeptidase-like regulatory domain-containing protein [Flavisolibacter sp.]
MRVSLTLIFLVTAFLQMSLAQRPVTGRVTDDKGEALSGVSVVVKGESGGATTTKEGRYSISVPAGKDTLVFSFV